MIIRGGYNIYPREVEEVLLRHPAVAQVAVIGLPDAQLGEEVCAVVVPAAGSPGDDKLAVELLAHGRDELASHKYPRRIDFTDELPLRTSGKVLKRGLAARLRAASHDHYVCRMLAGLAAAPGRICLWRKDDQLTARQFRETVLTAADVLRRQFAGDPAPVVAVLTVTNSPATIILRYAANLAGATVVHLHSTNAVDPTDQLAADARREILGRTGATLLAVDEENADAGRELCGKLPEPPRLAALGLLGPDVLDLSSGDPDAFDLDTVQVDPDQPAVVICTSGTSGRPKAVAMPYRVRALHLEAGRRGEFKSPEPLVYLATLPVCNSSGAVVDLALASGDLSSITNITYVGSPAAPARLAEALNVFGPVLTQIYGTTEASPISVLGPADHLDPQLLATAGRPTAEVRIRSLDSDEDAQPGGIGEVCVRSPSIMLGYWGEPELTAATARDGWLHTGDLSSLDANGVLRLHGRMGEVVKTNGIKIHPRDVEHILLIHPEVAQAAVYCVVDDDHVEHLHAAVVMRPDSTADAGALIRQVAAELSAKHVPASVVFHDVLPLTGMGKLDKQLLAALHNLETC
ncbi:AMP-binding protein [Lentzea sp. NPDC006480]|uniref:AMP-binding protein n=1 Tax=Lentzea sp. NPDC006480 TaxID=3157176 RepID=UPI0033BCFB1E